MLFNEIQKTKNKMNRNKNFSLVYYMPLKVYTTSLTSFMTLCLLNHRIYSTTNQLYFIIVNIQRIYVIYIH